MVTDYNKNIDMTVSKDMSSSSTRVAEQAGKEGFIVRRIDRELLDNLHATLASWGSAGA